MTPRPLIAGAMSALVAAGMSTGASATDLFVADTSTEYFDLVFGGFVEAGAGWVTLSESNDEPDELDDHDYPLLALRGAVSIPVAPALSIQVDGAGEAYILDPGTVDNQVGVALGGAHLSWRDPSRGLIGVFAGGGNGWTNRPFGITNAVWAGVEGQVYAGDNTLYAQAAYLSGDVPGTEETFTPAVLLRGVFRHFFPDDGRFEAELSFAGADDAIDGSDDVRVYSWGARYDRPLMETDWYGFVAYRGTYVDTTTEGEHTTEHAVMVGIKRLFGVADQKQNDRLAATLDQPSLGIRAPNWIEPLD